uniref:Sodium-coupled monocarboxylate transporter 1 n=1 Tax=Plectus sambesii TaxID=2011161 RepID=A0A914WKI0_9BILA
MFTTVDYCIFAAFIGLSMLVGIYHALKSSRQQAKAVKSEKTAEFLLGGRKLPIIPVCLSLLTTFISGLSLLGAPAEIYQRGFLFWPMYWSSAIAFLISGYFFVPIFYKLQATSVYEYFEKRYNSKLLRRIGAALFLSTTWFYMAVVMYAPAIALTGVTQVPLWPFILAVGLASTFYTSIGGMKAVIWTDTIQAFFIYLGIGILLFKGTSDAGGLQEVFRISMVSGRFDALKRTDPSPLQHNNLWIMTFGSVLWWSTMYGLNQMALQRYCSMPSLKHARILIGITVPAFLILGSMCCYIGVVMLAYFYYCNPIESGEIESQDQLVILFAAKVLGFFPGLPGLFLACLFSGTLSTISSGINSMTAVLWEDFLKDSHAVRLGDTGSANLNKMCAFIFGIGATLMAFLCQYMDGMINAANSVLGAIAGPLAGLFFLGIFFPRANKNGAFIAVILTVSFFLFCSVGHNLNHPYANYALPTNFTCERNETFFGSLNASYSAKSPAFVHAPYDPHYGKPEVFFAYKLSAFSYAPLSVAMVIVIGYVASILMPQKMTPYQRKLAYSLTYVGRNTFMNDQRTMSKDDESLIHKSEEMNIMPSLRLK